MSYPVSHVRRGYVVADPSKAGRAHGLGVLAVFLRVLALIGEGGFIQSRMSFHPQLSIVRDELKKIQGKVYTTERPKIETLFREMDKLARQIAETRRENRDRSEIVNEITRLSLLADSLSKSKHSQ